MTKRGLAITPASSISTLGWIPPGIMDLSTFSWCSWSLTISQKESHCSHTFMFLQLKGPGSPRPTRVNKDLGNKNQVTLNASTFSFSQLEGWSPSQVSLPMFFLDLLLLLSYFLQRFVLSATTLASFNSNWDLAFPVFSLHANHSSVTFLLSRENVNDWFCLL